MTLTPVNQDDRSWSLVDPSGKTVKKGFEDRAEAIGWARDKHYAVNDTGGRDVEQDGEGRF